MIPFSLTVEYTVKDKWVLQIGSKRQKVLYLAKMTRFSAMCAKITNVAKSSERNKKQDFKIKYRILMENLRKLVGY